VLFAVVNYHHGSSVVVVCGLLVYNDNNNNDNDVKRTSKLILILTRSSAISGHLGQLSLPSLGAGTSSTGLSGWG